MHKSSISILSQEGRQKMVSWEFMKVIKLKLTSPHIHLSQTKMLAVNKIIEFAQHHGYSNEVLEISTPLAANDISEVVKNEWDSRFFTSLNVDTLIDIINACEYLGYKALSTLSQVYLSLLFKSQSIEELKESFQVEDEFQEEQAEKELDLFLSYNK